MANIAKRPDGRWRARYRDASGAEHSRHFARKVDAQNWLDGVTTSVTTGTQVDPRLSKITVGEWAPRWLATKVNLKQSTRVTYEILLHKHILPTWADARLSSVTHEGVAAWVAGLEASGLSASSIRQTHRVFALLLGLAVRDGRLARNPAAGVALPRTVRAEQVYLTHVRWTGWPALPASIASPCCSSRTRACASARWPRAARPQPRPVTAPRCQDTSRRR